jgi:C-terminal processing protease CtpA/Prc
VQHSVSVIVAGLLLAGCSVEAASTAPPVGPVAVDDAGAVPPAPIDSEPLCNRVLGVPALPDPSARPDLALSSAHAMARYFGTAPSNPAVDGALVEALRRTEPAVTAKTLSEFASLLDEVCQVPAAALPEAQVTRRGTLAVVHPGSGTLELPEDAAAIAIDLRTVPGGAATDAALAKLAARFGVAKPLRARVHVRTGFSDEAYIKGVYTDTIEERDVFLPSKPVGTDERPVAIVVGERIAPEAARFALAMRAARRAVIAGERLPAAIAEMRWDGDVAIRVMDVVLDGKRVADELEADLASDDAAIDAWALEGSSEVPQLGGGSAKRTTLAERIDFREGQKGSPEPAVVRAGLLSAHGAAKLFFPYFQDIGGDHTDDRLAETLEAAASVQTRAEARNVLRRFGNVLQDGHNWTADSMIAQQAPIPIVLDLAKAGPIVQRSYVPELTPGDRLVSIEGEDALTWFAREESRPYGATAGFRFRTASTELISRASLDLVVADPAGTTRTTRVNAKVVNGDLYAGSVRPAGWLGDLGAPGLYYFNADGRYAKSQATVDAALAEAMSGDGLVIDMRGHPANMGAQWDPYDLVSRIATTAVTPPLYRVPVLDGAGGHGELRPYQDVIPPSGTFTKPVVLIIDSMAVSFAEDLAMYLVTSGRLRAVIGRPTAGTTGSVAGMQLPGGFQFFMTGMEARWPNGERLFGRGVEPTIVIEPTAADYAAGRDPMLLRAIESLNAN